jgi:small subunit ribosomal protein S29
MFPLPLELRDALKLDYDHPMSPYDKRSPLLLEYAQGLKALPVPEKLTIEEASSLMSIWKNENVLVGGKLFSSLLFFSIRDAMKTEQPAS